DATVLGGIDIVMSKGFTLAGALRDTSNQPLSGGVSIYTDAGALLGSVNTDSVGHYSIGPLRQGTFRASANSSGHGSQLYAGVACSGPLQQNCDVSKATPIAITDRNVGAVNFNLPLLATIQGTVTTKDLGVANGFQIVLLDQYGSTISSSYYYYGGQY